MSWRPPDWWDSTVAAALENQRQFDQLRDRLPLRADLERLGESARQAAAAIHQPPYREIWESTRGIFGPIADLQLRPDRFQDLLENLHGPSVGAVRRF